MNLLYSLNSSEWVFVFVTLTIFAMICVTVGAMLTLKQNAIEVDSAFFDGMRKGRKEVLAEDLKRHRVEWEKQKNLAYGRRLTQKYWKGYSDCLRKTKGK